MIIQKDLSGKIIGKYPSLRKAAKQTHHGRKQLTQAVRKKAYRFMDKEWLQEKLRYYGSHYTIEEE
jgi:hypothetical protein